MIKRHLEQPIVESLRDFPVVLLIGARQVGKTTLAKAIAEGRWSGEYFSLDDRSVLDAALVDPDGFIAGNPPPMVIDEVQRAPDLMRAVKAAVDRDRRPGMYLLTGSADPLRMKSVSETLAGRMAIFRLDTFSWAEVEERRAPVSAVQALLESDNASSFLSRFRVKEVNPRRDDVQRLVLSGGYPDPLMMNADSARSKWFDSYRKTYLERDVKDITSIADLPLFGRLLRAMALRTANLLNLMDISRELSIPYTTLRRYVGLLETTFQIEILPPYHANIAKRLVKTPKIFFDDTGMACHLTGLSGWAALEQAGLSGRMLETWVWGEIRKTLPLLGARVETTFWREQHGGEVDFVLEGGTRLTGIEVKGSATVTSSDIRGLEGFLKAMKGRAGVGVILYGGNRSFALRDNIVAMPISLFLRAERRVSTKS